MLSAKVMGVILFFMVARWSWPRFRFDQLMALAWKVMLPLGMVNLAWVAVWDEYGRDLGLRHEHLAMAVCGWTVLLATWLVGTRMTSGMYDNRPRRNVAEAAGPSILDTEEALAK